MTAEAEAPAIPPLLLQAVARHRAGDLAGAVGGYRAYLAANPDHASTWSNLGLALKLLGDTQGAIQACRRAVALNGANANALNNLGLTLVAAYRIPEAIEAYRRALALDPRFPECWCNLGQALAAAKQPAAAVDAFQRTLALAPDHAMALAHLVHQSQQQCAWGDLDGSVERLKAVALGDAGEVDPFVLLATCSDPAELVPATRNFARRIAASVAHLPRPRHRPQRSDRLRIGYLSGNYHDCAVGQLAVELFEHHDRSRFEVTGYSFGPDDGTALRHRLAKAFERFTDIASLSTAAAAQRIADDGIDILVDLMGYTHGARAGIMALRPAPLQVAYLGYPGPVGAAFVDYSVVDRFVVPPENEWCFDEKLLVLPGCYQPNDSRRRSGGDADAGSRGDHGLPAKGFVFCCFNQAYKITPEVFGWWIGLLLEVPDSVLWLLAFNRDAQDNLRRELTACGIAPDRLIFADRRPLARHLARLRHADLFLDTWPYGAHTTASDALWAGLPVLTCPGAGFAARVAGSLLTVLGLDELIADSPDDYAERARRLAADQAATTALKTRVRRARDGSDLFSGAAAARKLESAYMAIWQRHAIGLAPTTIDLSQP